MRGYNVLDNSNVLKQKDPQDALGAASGQWDYFSHTFEARFKADDIITNIVWAGMGGSALPAMILRTWLRLSVPLEIVRDYDIPSSVRSNTLFVAASFSGNTEETIEALEKASRAGAYCIVITTGGMLAEVAKKHGYPLFLIPAGVHSRMSAFCFVNAFLHATKDTGIITSDPSEFESIGPWLRAEIEPWGRASSLEANMAKQLAMRLAGKTVIVYSGPKLSPAAYKWKLCFNENAKNTAWMNTLPEFSHNEFVGWSSHPVEKPFGVVEMRSDLEHERISKRFEVTEQLLSGLRPSPIVVSPGGDTLLQQLAWTFALGDFVSIYLAILNGVNPTPVTLVDTLKRELG